MHDLLNLSMDVVVRRTVRQASQVTLLYNIVRYSSLVVATGTGTGTVLLYLMAVSLAMVMG
jgi:hypothetical protein